MTVEPAFR